MKHVYTVTYPHPMPWQGGVILFICFSLRTDANALDPRPYTLYPIPYTLDPIPETLDPRP